MKSLNVVWFPVLKPVSPASYLCLGVSVGSGFCTVGFGFGFGKVVCLTNPLPLSSASKFLMARKSDVVYGAVI